MYVSVCLSVCQSLCLSVPADRPEHIILFFFPLFYSLIPKIAVQYYAFVATDLLARLATCQLHELESSSAQYVACLFGL